MIGDSTAHRVFKIGELTRAVASQLVLTGKKNAVNLACASRYLEEPVLSTLWGVQSSLCTLLKVLPGEYWNVDKTKWNCDVVCGLDLPFKKLNT